MQQDPENAASVTKPNTRNTWNALIRKIEEARIVPNVMAAILQKEWISLLRKKPGFVPTVMSMKAGNLPKALMEKLRTALPVPLVTALIIPTGLKKYLRKKYPLSVVSVMKKR